MQDMFEAEFRTKELPLEIRSLLNTVDVCNATEQTLLFLALEISHFSIVLSEELTETILQLQSLEHLCKSAITVKQGEYINHVKKGK